jgi:hypothetical protein
MDAAHNLSAPSGHPALTERHSHDVEKHPASIELSSSPTPKPSTSSVSSAHGDPLHPPYPHDDLAAAPIRSPLLTTLSRWNTKIESLAGLEARGITRVLPSERHGANWLTDAQMVFLWFSANVTANNLAVGFLGPLLFGLGWSDSVAIAIGGVLVGSLGTAYLSVWGAASGNRTMVAARFFMGYWPSKLCALLNIVLMVGFGMIDCIIGGQILSAVSGGSLTIIVGIVIVALISWVVAVFGMSIFHQYER